MYDELIKRLRECTAEQNGEKTLWHQAADAIEELQKQLREEKVDNVNLTGWLAEEHANKCPHYIRNVHDRGDDSLCMKYVCEVKMLPKWIPVTERLPKENGFYLCLYKHKAPGGVAMDEGLSILQWINNKWGINDIYLVTHWMPIPEPPKDGEQ